MKCPVCGAPKLKRDSRDLPYAYKGEKTVIEAVTGDYCPACGEVVLDDEESTRVSAEALAFNRQVNATLADPGEITDAREALRLGQREASLLFGGGINAFNRYESGKIKPPRALMQLLRLLRNHPQLLDEVRRDSQAAAMAGSGLSVQQKQGQYRRRSRK